MIFDPIGSLFYLVCLTFGQCTDAQCGVITGVLITAPTVIMVQVFGKFAYRGMRVSR